MEGVDLDTKFFSFENGTPADLDLFLANGYYRMYDHIFTTHFDEEHIFIWLRLNLEQLPALTRFTKENSRLAGNIKWVVSKAGFSGRHQQLYERYQQRADFDSQNPQLEEMFHGLSGKNHYDTWMVELWWQGELVAVNYFDKGVESVAGIKCIFDPAHKGSRLGLGIMCISKAIEYCKEQGFRYFYPGYFVPGNHRFDYKLRIGTEALQFYHPFGNEWLPITVCPFVDLTGRLPKSILNK